MSESSGPWFTTNKGMDSQGVKWIRGSNIHLEDDLRFEDVAVAPVGSGRPFKKEFTAITNFIFTAWEII